MGLSPIPGRRFATTRGETYPATVLARGGFAGTQRKGRREQQAALRRPRRNGERLVRPRRPAVIVGQERQQGRRQREGVALSGQALTPLSPLPVGEEG